MRVIFMGTPEFSVPALRAVAAAHEVVAVYSQPPRAAGRGQKLRALLTADQIKPAMRVPTNGLCPVARAGRAGIRRHAAPGSESI